MGKSLYNMSEQQEWEGEKSQEFLDNLSRMSAEVKQQLKGGSSSPGKVVQGSD